MVVLVRGSLSGSGATASTLFSVDRGAVDIGLVLPDRDAMFDFVDEVLTGGKGFSAMAGSDHGDDGRLANGDVPDSMNGHGMRNGETLHGFLNDLLSLWLSHDRVMLICEALYGLSFMVITHESVKEDDCTAGFIPEFCA